MFTSKAPDFVGKLSQIGIVCADLDEAMARYGHMLGVGGWKRLDTDYTARFRDWTGRVANHNAFAPWGDIHIELVQPGEGGGIAKDWLQTRGEGIFHFAFGTEDTSQRPGGAEVVFANLDRLLPSGEPEIIMLDTVEQLGWYMEIVPQAMADSLNARVRSADW